MSDDETKSDIFRYRHVVSEESIDVNGHVNNVAYVQWMQDVAVAHSRDRIERGTTQRLGCPWVAREHRIEYLRPAFVGDELEIRTWLDSVRRVRCRRVYEFYRQSDDQLLAKGETDWVFVNIESGRPVSIPEEISSAFILKQAGSRE